MKTKFSLCSIVPLVALMLTSAPTVRSGEPTDDEKKLQAALDTLLDIGGTLMVALKPDEKLSKSSYTQVQFDDKPCGYDIQTLIARKQDKDIVYDYEQEKRIRFSNGARFAVKITATLTPYFKPLEIHIVQSQTPPKITEKQAEHNGDVTIKFSDKEIEIIDIQDGKKNVRSEKPIEEAFVFATDMLLRVLDVNSVAGFALSEFNPSTGKTGLAVFRKIAAKQGFCFRAQRQEEKSEEEFYYYDAKGIMYESGKTKPPLSEKLASKEFIEALKPIIDK